MTEELELSSAEVEVKPEGTNGTSVSVSASDCPDKATTSTESMDDGLAKAASALSQGKRSLLIKDVQQALSSLSDACNLYSQLVGSFGAPEAHYYYGKALLESARCELSVLPAEAVEKITETNEGEDDDEEEEEESEKEEDEEEEEEDKKMEEDLNEPSPTPAVANDDATPGSSSDTPPTASEEKPAEGIDASTEADAATTKLGEGGEEELEQSSLELAWEVLEIAKVSYQKELDDVNEKLNEVQQKEDEPSKDESEKLVQKIKDLKRKLADTHLLLGDVATESEFYEQAQAEFRTSLTILRDTEQEAISREIAQCYFQLGLAYHFDKKFTESIECYQKAITLIKNRIAEFQSLIDKKQTMKDLDKETKDPNYSEAAEITELEGIVRDLEDKVADTMDAQKDSLRTKEEEKVEQEIMERNSPVKNPKPMAVNDISHLVKKKKKLDEDETEKMQPPAKKQCMDPVNLVVVDASHAEADADAAAVSSTNGNGKHHDEN